MNTLAALWWNALDPESLSAVTALHESLRIHSLSLCTCRLTKHSANVAPNKMQLAQKSSLRQAVRPAARTASRRFVVILCDP